MTFISKQLKFVCVYVNAPINNSGLFIDNDKSNYFLYWLYGVINDNDLFDMVLLIFYVNLLWDYY